ncbi:AF4/FMR2 family member 4-like isoform X3 [Anomalospiza imberbis]|uniref:AF4/FMR2 family member 4-like isoform X3 n=1 Tax=Anomalospiza imberbis TaxID=187417 RepID=UPI00358F4AA6
MCAVPCVSHCSGAQHMLDRTNLSTVSFLRILTLLCCWTCAVVRKPQFLHGVKPGVQVLTLFSVSLSESWSNNRNLLCLLEQERRRRQVAPEEKDPFLAKTPLFAKPYKTDKEDELSRRIKNLLGNVDSKMLLSHESSLIPIWIPKKPKIKSQTQSHRPASSKTNPYEDIRKESSRESLGLPPNPEPSRDDSDKGHSNQRSEAKAPQSKILPEPVKGSPVRAQEDGTSTAQQLGVREHQGLPQLLSLCTSKSTSTRGECKSKAEAAPTAPCLTLSAV